MMRRILLTRPVERLAASRTVWQEAGFETLDCPLLKIQPVQSLDTIWQHGTMWIVTSGAAVGHGLKRLARTDDTVLAVGEATARMAGGAGFQAVEVAGEQASDIVGFLEERKPDARRFVHLAGEHTAFDLVKALKEIDIECERTVCYSAEAADHLSDAVKNALESQTVTDIPFYSARALTIFEALISKNGLADCARHVQLYIMSERIADSAHLPWKAVHVADSPTEVALVAIAVSAGGQNSE